MAAANAADLLGDDEAANARYDAYNAAERALFRAQAPRSFDVWRKWEVLDYLVTCEVGSGRATDCRLVAAVGSIKADVLRFLD